MPAVFISYSRKDFYFAESLAFHLAKRGVPNWLDANLLAPGGDWAEEIDRALDEAQTVVLVLTADSLRSEYVRAEWQRALHEGHRVVLVLFRFCKLPPELAQAQLIDFRGSFKPALQRLLTLLNSAPDAAAPPSSPAKRGVPRVPPWVALVAVVLASIFLFPLIFFGDWSALHLINAALGTYLLSFIMLPFFLVFIIWHSCVAFLRRRMGTTRLALVLTLFTAVYGFYFLGRTGAIPAITARTKDAQYNIIPLPILIGIVATGCAALAIVLLLRPEDLMRWCPTGKVWDRYRRGRTISVPDLPTRLKNVRRFQLLHDAEDAPAAARLREDLLAAGATEATTDLSDATQVILLTNRTTTAWLTQRTELMQTSVVTVIGSAIGLPKSLSSLWRRQWIDLRRWDAARKQTDPVPAVPEGMTRLRLPRPVRAMEQLLCAIAGLFMVFANAVFIAASDDNFLQTLGVLLCLAPLCWIVTAWKLIHRTITLRHFSRAIRILSGATIILGLYPWFLVSLGGNFWRALPAGVFALALPFLSVRLTRRLYFWFPAAPEPGMKFAQRLNAPRKWDAVIWSLVYMAFWMWLLGIRD